MVTWSPADVVNGVWKPGQGGCWDRVTALRYAVMAQGGIGKAGDTEATVDARLRAVEQVLIGFAHDDPNDFLPYVIEDGEEDDGAGVAGPVVTPGLGKPIEQGRMHWEIHRALDAHKNVAIKAYRGSGKTTQVEGRIMHLLGTDPRCLIKIVSEAKETAQLRVTNVRDHIDRNPRVRWVFPNLRRDPNKSWTDGKLFVERPTIQRDPSLSGFGYNSRAVGGRVSHLVGDDVTPPEAATSTTIRNYCTQRWQNVWAKMLLPHGRIWFAYTPWSTVDLGAIVEANETFHSMTYATGGPSGCKACPDLGGAPCTIPFHNPWSAAWPPESLRFIYVRDTAISFNRSHLLDPLSAEGSLYPEHVLAHCRRPDLTMRQPWRWLAHHGIRTVLGADLSISADANKSDYTAVVVLGWDHRGNRYVVDVIREAGVGYARQINMIAKACVDYRVELAYVEAVQYQAMLAQLAVHLTALPIRPFYTMGRGSSGVNVEGANKRHLQVGMPGLRLLFENEKVYFPYGDLYSRQQTEVMLDELRHMHVSETGAVESSGTHDDTALAFWFADRAAYRLGAGMPTARVDADDDLDGLEDGSARFDGPLDLSVAQGLKAPGAGAAVQVQVPANAPVGEYAPALTAADDYAEAYAALRDVPPAVAASLLLGDVAAGPPAVQALRDAGYGALAAGRVVGLWKRLGGAAVQSVVRDVLAQREGAAAAADPLALEAIAAKRVDELYSDEDEEGLGGMPDQLWLTIPGAVGVEPLG